MSYDMDFLNTKEVKTSKHEEDDDEDTCSDEECTLCNKDACLSFLKEKVSLGLPPSSVIKRAEEAGCIPELLESEEGSKYRPYYYLSSEMDSLLKRDDGDEFASFLTTNHDLILKFPPHEIFKTICNKGAATCAAAYLQSPPHPHHVPDKDEHYHLAQYCLNFGLSDALHSQHYNLYQVLYSYSARAAAFPHDDHLLESHLSELWCSRNLQRWESDDDPKSFFKLIHFFCSPELKGARDLIKWLASNTKQLEQLCLKFIEKGQIISLAALLIVSRDSLLMPSSSEEGGVMVI